MGVLLTSPPSMSGAESDPITIKFDQAPMVLIITTVPNTTTETVGTPLDDEKRVLIAKFAIRSSVAITVTQLAGKLQEFNPNRYEGADRSM